MAKYDYQRTHFSVGNCKVIFLSNGKKVRYFLVPLEVACQPNEFKDVKMFELTGTAALLLKEQIDKGIIKQ